MTKNCFLGFVLFSLMSLVGFSQPVEKVLFSSTGGFYEESFALELFHFYPQNQIRYTTNGNPPTAQSQLYSEPLFLDQALYSTSDIYTIQVTPDGQMFYPDSIGHCIVIRAAVFDENDSCVSEVATNSYFIHSLGCDTHGLPVMSLCSDSLSLFDYYRGIMVPGSHYNPDSPNWTGNYYCKGLNWERRCNVEFYELDNRGVNQQAGLRTHGGGSRRLQQKGLKVYAKEEYGKKRFKHAFFQETPVDSFKHLSLKPFRCSNWRTTGLQDALAQQLARPLNMETLCCRQMVLFINGEYWGIYTLEEVPDEHYLEDHLEVDSEHCNIIKKWKILDHGDSTHWHNLYQWMSEADVSLQENYAYVDARIDLDNFIDYKIFEIYSSNVDWPANNTRCWQEGEGKWRWIFYDGDGCFFRDWDVFANVTDTSDAINPANAYVTLFFRKLIQNPTFLDRFHARFIQLMSDYLNYETIAPMFQSLCAVIEAEVPFQAARFGFPTDVEQWEFDVQRIHTHLMAWNESLNQKLDEFMENHIEVNEYPECPELSCFPNPSTGKVQVSFHSDQACSSQIQVFDVYGRPVYGRPVSLDAGNNQLLLPLPLSPGIYFLKINHAVTKIVRQ